MLSDIRKKKFSVQTSGCRLNQYESEKMAAQLTPFGFERAEPDEPADLYIINTCTITHRADSSSRHLIRKAARENPAGAIVVAGCYVDSDPEKIAGMEGVDLIVPNAQKTGLAQLLTEQLPDLFSTEPDKGCSSTIGNFQGHNRAWLGISDGCHQRCSFCILPQVRGSLRHRSPEEILIDVRAIIEQEFREICLTGLNIGYYKWNDGPRQIANLSELCRLILDETGIDRIRLSSVEPQTLDENLVDLYRERGEQICRHLHVSMQSGSSRLLKAMRRPYNRDDYLRRVSMLKDAIPNMIVGADIIVGFPGETNKDFLESRSAAETGLIDYLHVFSYSDRPGTVATDIPEKVHPEEIKERNAILTRISRKNKLAAHQRVIGETLGVISEFSPTSNRYHCGVADNYVRVRLPDGLGGGKEIVRIKITAANQDHLTGELVLS
jgi:threonylcarbamoyladenosine tRNA methylthiotransferase MtaB